MAGGTLVSPTPTDVTAAASVPPSSTSTYVLCFTSVMHSSEGTWVRVKSAVCGSHPEAMPLPSRASVRQVQDRRVRPIGEADMCFLRVRHRRHVHDGAIGQSKRSRLRKTRIELLSPIALEIDRIDEVEPHAIGNRVDNAIDHAV